MNVEPLERAASRSTSGANAPESVERESSSDRMALAALDEQQTKAQVQANHFTATVQENQYTGRGSLLDEIA